MEENHNKKSLLQRLWDRRFFQYLATYIGVSWGLIQFTDWIVNRYNLDSSWVDNLVIFLFALLPAMASFIYFHGQPGDDEWKPFEKIFYPINLVVALIASIFIFDGAAQNNTTQIEVTNIEGDTITRYVPSQSVTSKLIFFPMNCNIENEGWLSVGLPYLIDMDLEQDMKWYSIQPLSLKEDFLDLGYNLDEEISFSDKLKIATDLYSDYYVDGTLSKKDGQFEVEVNVYNTNKGNKEKSAILSSESIFDVSDQVTSFIRENFNNIKLDMADETIDLPSSDLITNDLEAFKTFTIGAIAFSKGPDHYAEAFANIDRSTELDPTCAECFFRKVICDQLRGDQGIESITNAINASRTLPERQRLKINYLSYLIKKETQKGTKLLDSWKKLYPKDISPYQKLIEYYSTIFQFSNAKEVAEEAVENGHMGSMILQAARLNMQAKDFENAEKYIEQYKREYPKKAKSTPLLAEIYIAKGQFDQAIEIYEEQNILNPSAISNQLKLAECHYKKNDFIQAENYYEDALKEANTPADSLAVLNDKMQYHIRFGRVNAYEEDRIFHRKIFESIYPREAYLQILMGSGGVYSAIGDEPRINLLTEEILELAPAFSKDLIGTVLDYVVSLWLLDADAFPEAYEKAKPIILQSASEDALASSEAMLNYFNGNYDKALEFFKKFEAIVGISLLDNSEILANCYIKSGKVDEGLEYVNNLLLGDPNHPIGLVSKAALLKEKGNNEKELKEIFSILDVVYKDAHPEWRYMKSAEAIKATLENI